VKEREIGSRRPDRQLKRKKRRRGKQSRHASASSDRKYVYIMHPFPHGIPRLSSKKIGCQFPTHALSELAGSILPCFHLLSVL
jgi:hypothetical protein